MPEYRLYFIRNDGHISRAPEICALRDDDEARQRARQILDGQTIEIWQGARLVAQVHPNNEMPSIPSALKP